MNCGYCNKKKATHKVNIVFNKGPKPYRKREMKVCEACAKDNYKYYRNEPSVLSITCESNLPLLKGG